VVRLCRLATHDLKKSKNRYLLAGNMRRTTKDCYLILDAGLFFIRERMRNAFRLS
jgi:hypothetical protein